MIEIMSDELGSLLEGLPGHERRFAAGATVFRRDDPVRVMHFVQRGTIHLVRRQKDGAALILQRPSGFDPRGGLCLFRSLSLRRSRRK